MKSVLTRTVNVVLGAGAVALIVLSVRTGPDTLARRGIEAYRQGRFADARELLMEAERAAGLSAGPELLFDQALAALRSGALEQAEIAAEKAAVRGAEPALALRDFLIASVAFARCEAAEQEALQTDAGPSAWDTAIRAAEAARSSWRSALERRLARSGEWPQARRNIRLAAAKLETLRKRKIAAIEKKRASIRRQVAIRPEIDEGAAEASGQKVTEPQELTPVTNELSPDRVRSLLEKLASKELEKRRLRRARYEAPSGSGTKDW